MQKSNAVGLTICAYLTRVRAVGKSRELGHKSKRNGFRYARVFRRGSADRRANWRAIADQNRSVRARKISSARLIVAKLKINATHARSLNLLRDANEFFRKDQRGLRDGVGVAIAEHNRDDAGNEYTTSLYNRSIHRSF